MQTLDKQWGQATQSQVVALQVFAKKTQDLMSWEGLWEPTGFAPVSASGTSRFVKLPIPDWRL